MQTSDVILTFLICGVPIIAIVLGFIAFRHWKNLKKLRLQLKELEQQYNVAANDSRGYVRSRWLDRVHRLSFANEVEVEVKFVYPLLLHLGYDETDFAIRYKVPMQMGREQLQKEADWVVWNRNNKNKVALIVEAKAPNQPLDATVQAQGRSYAFAMNAPMYVLTNGLELEVYLRGIEDDRCIFSCRLDQLAERWSDLDTLIGIDPTVSSSEPAQQGKNATQPQEVALVGESAYQENLRRICGKPGPYIIPKRINVWLEPEPNNPFDNMAVRAHINRLTVGYLSREDTRAYASRVGNGIEVSGEIRCNWEQGKDKGHYGVWVYL